MRKDVGNTVILIIDSEQDSRSLAAQTLQADGYTVQEAVDGESALRAVRESPPDLMILDLALTDVDSKRLLTMLKKKCPHSAVILTTRQRGIPSQSRLPDVDDYIEKPIDTMELLSKIRSIEIRQEFVRDIQFIGKNDKIIQVMETVLQVAPTDIQILITGESGTGKDVIAQAIHEHSQRSDGPYIPVNCGAIAEGVIDSELFGHEKGAFTSAVDRRKGVFEQADGGTIFLDEIGEMPLGTQVKLLRILEQQQFIRVGGAKPIETDVRIIAATNKDLEDAIDNGTFRRDLYYRLNAIPIQMPALRERHDDIPRLVDHFITKAVEKHNMKFAGFSDEAMSYLTEYDWPGNIRQLRNLIDRLVVTMKGRKVSLGDLPDTIYKPPTLNHALPVPVNRSREEVEREMIYKILLDLRIAINDLPIKVVEALKSPVPLRLPESIDWPLDTSGGQPLRPIQPVQAPEPLGTMKEIEKEAIRRALELHNGHREKAAKHLEIGVRTIYRKIEEYGLDESVEE